MHMQQTLQAGVGLGADGPITAKVQNKTTKTYSKIIPCTSEWDPVRTRTFLLRTSVASSVRLACRKRLAQGVTIGFTGQTEGGMRLHSCCEAR